MQLSRDSLYSVGAAFSQGRGVLLPRREQGSGSCFTARLNTSSKSYLTWYLIYLTQVKAGAGIKRLSLCEGQSQQWFSVHSSLTVTSRKRVSEARGGAGHCYVGIAWKCAACDRRCTVCTFHAHSPQSIQNQGRF